MPTMPKPDRPKTPGKLHQVRRPGATPRTVLGDTLRTRNARLYRRNPLCVMCLAAGRVREAEEWDHVTPVSDG